MDQLERSKVLAEFKASLKEKTLEELEALEAELVKKADDIDERVSKAEFKLATKGYKEMAEAVQYFLNKETVQWQFCLGMKTMYEFWNPENNPKKVGYPMLDSTLRQLGGLQFSGYKEWEKVCVVNEYFSSIRDEYAELTGDIYDTADRHSAVMQEMDLKRPVKEVEEGVQEELPA